MPNKTASNKPNPFYEPGIPEEFQYDPERTRPVPRERRHDAKPGETSDPRNTKVRVNIYLDLDVVNFFKRRAAQPDAAPYQTQIDNALRRIVEQESQPAGKEARLAEDPAFIDAVAARVAELLQARR